MNNYWRQMYGTQTQDFIDGVIAGITAYATWKNGKQVVGIREIPLDVEISNIKKGLGNS